MVAQTQLQMVSQKIQKTATMMIKMEIVTIAPAMVVSTRTLALEMIFMMPCMHKSTRMTQKSGSTTTSTALARTTTRR